MSPAGGGGAASGRGVTPLDRSTGLPAGDRMTATIHRRVLRSWGLDDTGDDWRGQVACYDHHYDPEWWSIDGEVSPLNKRAVRICLDCPVRTRCRAWATAHPDLVAGMVYAAMAWVKRGRRVQPRQIYSRNCIGCRAEFATVNPARTYCRCCRLRERARQVSERAAESAGLARTLIWRWSNTKGERQ